MSNIFQEVLTDVNGVKQKYLGDDYPYYKYIKNPSQIGMSSKGDLTTLGKDINGLISYVEVLVSGKSKASTTGQPLGNKMFLKTGAKCKDVSTGNLVDRYIYINNVPIGNIPFISQGLGVNFSEFKGLIPGVISNLNAFNPYTIMQSFLTGSEPDCQKITMETIDINNMKSTESNYVTLIDIKNMDPCLFKTKKNPITGQKCQETFTNMNTNIDNYENINELYNLPIIPDDIYVQIYFASLGILGIYILYKFMEKLKK